MHAPDVDDRFCKLSSSCGNGLPYSGGAVPILHHEMLIYSVAEDPVHWVDGDYAVVDKRNDQQARAISALFLARPSRPPHSSIKLNSH